MRKFFLIITILLFTNQAFSQIEDEDEDEENIELDSIEFEEEDEFLSFDIIYQNYLYQHSFNEQFNTLRDFNFGNPIQTVGFCVTSTFLLNKKYRYPGHMSYSQIIPQKVNVNDTLSGFIKGFNFSCVLWGLDLTPNSIVSNIGLSVGFNTGRIKISSRDYRTQKNPFFAPSIVFNPRFFIGRLVLAMRAEYQLDISKNGWRSVTVGVNEKTFEAQPFDQSGLILSFLVGLRL